MTLLIWQSGLLIDSGYRVALSDSGKIAGGRQLTDLQIDELTGCQIAMCAQRPTYEAFAHPH